MIDEPEVTSPNAFTAEDFRELERSRLRALVERNMELAWQLHAPDFQLITPSGRSYTRDRYLGEIAAGRLRYVRWEPGPMDVRLRGDTVLLRYQATLELDSGNGHGTPFQCWHIDLYELNGKLWQVVWSQATAIRPPDQGSAGMRVAQQAYMASGAAVHSAIRDATSADALCLGVLATQVFLDTYATGGIRPAIADEAVRAFSTSAIAALLGQANIHFRIAECDGHMIGFAQVTIGTPNALVHSAAPAELDRLYVQEPFTRRGVGSSLLFDAEMLAGARGATDLWLTPWIHNLRALRFYEKHGYADRGKVYFHMGEERHENRVLSKCLRR